MQRIILSIFLFCCALGQAKEWQINRQAENSVTYTSEVLKFNFSGTTAQIDGYIYWEGDRLFQKNHELYFEVDLRSLDSGIGKRDRDMRKILKTEQWPNATYKGKIIRYESIEASHPTYQVVSQGHFSVNGVSDSLQLPAAITIKPEGIQVTAQFFIKLSDFQIQAPSLAAFIKVSNDIQLDLNIYLKDVTE